LKNFLNKQGKPRDTVKGGVWIDPLLLFGVGYEVDPEWDRKKVSGVNARQLNKRAAECVQEGGKAVIQYNNLSLFGDEGYVSLYKKGALRAPLHSAPLKALAESKSKKQKK